MSEENKKMPPGRVDNLVKAGKGLKLDKGTFKRLIKRIFGKHKIVSIIVCLLIILSAFCDVQSSIFIGTVIDEYITPVIRKYTSDDIETTKNTPIDFEEYKRNSELTNQNNLEYDEDISEEHKVAYPDDKIVEISEVDNQSLIHSLWGYINKIVLILLTSIIATYTYNRLMIYIAQEAQKDIRNEMFSKMQKLPVKYFDTNKFGDIMSRYTNDIETLNDMISQSIPQIVSTVVTIIAVFISMARINFTLTMFAILLIIFLMSTTKNLAKIASKYSIKQQEDLGKINGYVEEMINGQKVIKVFTHEEKSIEDFDNLNNELYSSSVIANTIANIMMPIMGKMSRLQYVIIAIVGGIATINYNVMSIGKFVTFLQLTDRISMPINQITQQFASIVMALAGAKRIFNLLDEKEEIDEGLVELVNVDENGNEINKVTNYWAWKVPINILKKEEYVELAKTYLKDDIYYAYIPLKGHIEFFDVTFGYNEEKIILNDISLYAKPGQKIAFVGATGAGKTTITNLINRFYDIQNGIIKYDGINIKDIKKYSLRKSIGMVLQDTNLFTGTIKENIRYGNLNATDEDIINAAKLANAHSFIKRLPKGYDTILTENGSELSQGQRQLISIARAAVANPPVMILDEATSSIDTRTEKIVQEGMDKLMNGRTVLVIAHRLSTVRNAKAIMVLDHGNIIERGEHDFLIEQKGTYYKLYTGSFELE